MSENVTDAMVEAADLAYHAPTYAGRSARARAAIKAALSASPALAGKGVSEDQDEILRVADQLSRGHLYGASQMIYRLARQRDEARAASRVNLNVDANAQNVNTAAPASPALADEEKDAAGMSWSGFNIGGDRKSIDEVRRCVESTDTISWYQEQLMEAQAQACAGWSEVERLKKALEPFAQDMFDDDSWLPNDEVSVYADDYLLFRVTVSDFRNALAAMDKKDAQG